MSLFDIKHTDRMEYVARLLGCNTAASDTWPMALIEQLLHDAERAAERRLAESISMFRSERSRAAQG